MKREESLFIRRLTQLMEEKNLTQVELAEKIGITNVTISRYLSGERKPRVEIVAKLAKELNTTVDYLLGNSDTFSKDNIVEAINKVFGKKSFINKQLLPVLGTVKAGYNYLAEENIIDYIEPSMTISDPVNYFGLVVKGDSMAPLFDEGDYLIVHKTDGDFNTGDIGIVLINGDEATVKKLVKTETGIELQAFNPYYPAKKYTYEEMQNLPVKVIGVVVRQIRNWK